MEVAKGHRAATWELWRRPIDMASCLTDCGRAAAQWAVDRVSNFFGDAWLQEAATGSRQLLVVGPLEPCSSHL